MQRASCMVGWEFPAARWGGMDRKFLTPEDVVRCGAVGNVCTWVSFEPSQSLPVRFPDNSVDKTMGQYFPPWSRVPDEMTFLA